MSGVRAIGAAAIVAGLVGSLALVAHLDAQQTDRADIIDAATPMGAVAVANAAKPEASEAVKLLDAPNMGIVSHQVEELVAKPSAAATPPRARNIFALQRSSQTRTLSFKAIDGRNGTASLTNLNTVTNAWFILSIGGNMQGNVGAYHLENRDPSRTRLALADGVQGLQLESAGQTKSCDLWNGAPSPLEKAVASGLPYAPLCGGQIYLRNKVEGQYTDIERVTEFLRENVWSGEDIVGFVRDTIYQDAYRETGRNGGHDGGAPASSAPGAPPDAAISSSSSNVMISVPNYGVVVDGGTSAGLAIGRWYSVRDMPGVFSSMIRPGAVAETLVAKDKGAVNPLDEVESSAVAILTAFDLSQHEVRYAIGTKNPGVGWSVAGPRTSQPGPDGFGSTSPLVANGMANPSIISRVVATFSGGFKRDHSAFNAGEFAQKNNGSHYGFVEQGVVFSTLHPGLSTLYALDDGSVHMESWSEALNQNLTHVRFARQNGVPLIETGATGEPAPGRLVRNWGAGNWSSSLDSQLRTLRAGACIVEAQGRRFLIQGVFSTATPSAMALVFHAYGCQYAMLLDMNALEHAYLALYARHGNQIRLEHPFFGMTDADKASGGKVIPRFIGFPDNRDFFYVVRRSNPGAK